MTSKDPQSTRKILRKAEAAFDDPEAQERLAQEAIHLGETEELGRDELLALFDEGSDSEDSSPTVTITCYFEDTPVEDRSEIEEPLASFVEDSGLGEWVGSGQGSMANGPSSMSRSQSTTSTRHSFGSKPSSGS